MHFISNIAALLAAASLASANTVKFVSQDSTGRTVHFTPNSGMASVDSVDVPAGESVTVDIPDSWVGNWYAISEGSDNKPGMLGEVAFNSWGGLTYFDVSAIVDATDHNGVKQIYPASEDGTGNVSGCLVFPCNSAYYLPDDVQTKSTSETDLICTLGTASESKREAPKPMVYSRKFVLGQH